MSTARPLSDPLAMRTNHADAPPSLLWAPSQPVTLLTTRPPAFGKLRLEAQKSKHITNPEASKVKATWQIFLGEDGGWTKFDAEIERKIEDALAAGDRQIVYSARFQMYEVDLDKMSQRNTKTGKTRTIRLGEAGAMYETPILTPILIADNLPSLPDLHRVLQWMELAPETIELAEPAVDIQISHAQERDRAVEREAKQKVMREAATKTFQKAEAVRAERERRERELQEAESKVDAFLTANGFKSATTRKSSMFHGSSYALHAAVRNNDSEMIRLLVLCNADPQQKNSSNQTPMELAVRSNRRESHANVISTLDSL